MTGKRGEPPRRGPEDQDRQAKLIEEIKRVIFADQKIAEVIVEARRGKRLSNDTAVSLSKKYFNPIVIEVLLTE